MKKKTILISIISVILLGAGVFTIYSVFFKYKVVDYFPSSGTAGTYVYIELNNDVARRESRIEVSYNDQVIEDAAYYNNSIRVKVPRDATSGEISVKVGRRTLKPLEFSVLNTRLIPINEKTIRPSTSSQVIDLTEEIAVRLPGRFLTRSTTMSLSEIENPPPSILNVDNNSSFIDISIDGMTQLPANITVRVKYDPEDLNPNYSATEQLIVSRWDEETETWTSLPTRVNEELNHLYFFTDHLSIFQLFPLSRVLTREITGEDKSAYLSTQYFLSDYYTTPQRNFRFLYNKSKLSNHEIVNNWDTIRPTFLNISYSDDYPVYIQDIGELFEMALQEYINAGFIDPVRKEGWIRGTVINPINVKLDSFIAWMGSAPSYENIFQYIHLPFNSLNDLRSEGPLGLINIGHELFHRIQAEYYGLSGLYKFSQYLSSDFWWIEATAEYAGTRLAWKDKNFSFRGQFHADFLSFPINTTGIPPGLRLDAPYWGVDYEYAAGHFIYYLVEIERDINFRTMVQVVSRGGSFSRLNSFLNARTGRGLAEHYESFARWAVFNKNSFLNGFHRANFRRSQILTDEITEARRNISIPDNKQLLIGVERNNNMNERIEVYRLYDGQTFSRNSVPRPVKVLHPAEYFLLTNLNVGDEIYFLKINTTPGRNVMNLSVSSSHDLETQELFSHQFVSLGQYSAKLAAIKLTDIELRIIPDTISGIPGEPVELNIRAQNLYGDIEKVYFEYDFGDNERKSKGETSAVNVNNNIATTSIKHKYKDNVQSSNVRVIMKDKSDDAILAEATAYVQFIGVSIEGDRNITISEANKTHTFTARATPAGNYEYKWSFGDGKTLSDKKAQGQLSTATHTYKDIREGQTFNVSVELFDNNNLVAKDEVVVRVEEEEAMDTGHIDGFETVRIGNQLWMAKNLDVDVGNNWWPKAGYWDGSAWNWRNHYEYGRLYDWESAVQACASVGWRLPDLSDWTQLIAYLGSDEVAGGKLKSTKTGEFIGINGTNPNPDGHPFWYKPNTGATNESGFSALPGGGRRYGNKDGVGYNGYWWSASEAVGRPEAWSLKLLHKENRAWLVQDAVHQAFSVRCIKD